MASVGQEITLQGATRRFGDVVALDKLTISIESGSIALLGRNGAGKSTMLNLVSGVLFPTSGRVSVSGFRPGTEEAAALVSRQLEFPGTAGYLTARRVSRLLALDRAGDDRFQENLSRFDVPAKPMSKLSRGNQLKSALAVSFARDRPVLLLDEPTSGLDVFGVEVLADLIDDRRSRGLITIAATHQPTLTPDLFDRAVVIDKGGLLFDGGLDQLLHLAPDTPENAAPTARLASAFVELLRESRS